jgi:tetratricopeptide (TPR) repeat protein
MVPRASGGNSGGLDDPSVGETCTRLGAALHKSGDYRQAEAVYWRALAIHFAATPTAAATRPGFRGDSAGIGIGGNPGTPVAVARHGVAKAMEQQGNYTEALVLQREALDAAVATLGPHHVHVAEIRTEVGVLLEGDGRWAAAAAEYRMALRIQLAVHGMAHFGVGSTYCDLARWTSKPSDPSDAIELYHAALQSSVAVAGGSVEHPLGEKPYNGMALVFQKRGNQTQALAM